MNIPRLPSDRDTFDKSLLVLVLFGFCGLTTWFVLSGRENGSTWAMQQAATILGALLLKINSDRKPNPPDQPQEVPAPTVPPPTLAPTVPPTAAPTLAKKVP